MGMLTVKEICQLTGKSKSTVYRWLAEGLQPVDEKAVLAWKEQKETEARGAAKDTSESLQNAPGKADTFDPAHLPPPGQPGAGACLKRLQENEVAMAQLLEAAKATGDEIKIRRALTNHKIAAELMHRYEKSVSQFERDTQSLIPRVDAESAVRMSAVWLRLTVMAWLSSHLPTILAMSDNPRAAKAKFLDTFCEILKVSLANAKDARAPLPAWAEQIIRDEFRA